MSERDEAILMIYESVAARLPMGPEDFIKCLDDWDITPLKQGGKIIGGVMAKSNEVHIGYGERPRASILPHLKKTLHKFIYKYGYVITYVQKSNQKGLNFCKRLGFVELSEDCDKIMLKCQRSNYAR